MATRSLTKIYNGDVEVFCMYKHYDGYVEKPGLGSELKQLMQDYVDNCSDYSARAIKSLICAVYMSGTAGDGQTYIKPIGLVPSVDICFIYNIFCDPRGISAPVVIYTNLCEEGACESRLLWRDQVTTVLEFQDPEEDYDLVSNIQDWQR